MRRDVVQAADEHYTISPNHYGIQGFEFARADLVWPFESLAPAF
jgi:hypothetical protein